MLLSHVGVKKKTIGTETYANVGDEQIINIEVKKRTDKSRSHSRMDTYTKNIKHLYDVTHAVPNIPSVGAMYTRKFMKTCSHGGLLLPPVISEGVKFCSHCGCVLIAGINMSMRVVYSKQAKKSRKPTAEEKVKKPRDRNLRISCFTCNKTMSFELLKPTPPVVSKPVEKKPFVATWNPNQNNQDVKQNKAKERAKKRKRNNLSNLLESKKQAEEKEKKSNLLSLDDFMKL